jgi:translation initiation factor IF-3
VKSTVIFRGRELVHSEIGRRILTRLAVELTEVALVEVAPRQEGMTMVQILTPKKEAQQKAKKPADKHEGKSAKKDKGKPAEERAAAPEPQEVESKKS